MAGVVSCCPPQRASLPSDSDEGLTSTETYPVTATARQARIQRRNPMANSGSFRKGEKRPNQGKRGPNKATLEVREAIGKLAQANVEKVQGWLDRIGKEDPDKALSLFLQMIEYHIPKLARSEHTGADGSPLFEKIEREIVRPSNPNG